MPPRESGNIPLLLSLISRLALLRDGISKLSNCDRTQQTVYFNNLTPGKQFLQLVRRNRAFIKDVLQNPWAHSHDVKSEIVRILDRLKARVSLELRA